ncbi:MAG: hypothetical protein ACR2LK_02295 [Solirubrobacteraceae bacterium]
MVGTPLFGEVDAWVQARALVLWRLREPAFYPLADAEDAPGSMERDDHYPSGPVEYLSPAGMLSWANAIYVRDTVFARDVNLPWEQRLRRDRHDALRFHDLSLWSLRRLLETDAPDELRAELDAYLRGATERRMPGPAVAPEPSSRQCPRVAAALQTLDVARGGVPRLHRAWSDRRRRDYERFGLAVPGSRHDVSR